MRTWQSHITLLFVCAFASIAGAEEVNRLKAEVVTIAEGAAALESTARAQSPMTANTRVASRLNDGQVFFLSKQYSRAAIVLMDLADRPGISAHPAYSDILYYLSDSLFQMSNDKSAAEYLKVLKRKARKNRREWAIGRLLQICARRSDVDFCDDTRTEAFREITANSLSTLKYALGKSLYRNNELTDAKRVFGLISRTEAEWFKANYFIGVIYVKNGDLDTSLLYFKKVLDAVNALTGDVSQAQIQIRNQSRLAVARVLYEQGKLDEALDNYNQVDRQSSAFDDAIQESIWVSIKRGDYRQSLRQLELMMIKQDDVTTGYRSHLLKGRLLILLNEYSRAQDSFGVVTDAFLPVRNQLEKTIKMYPDLEAHFQRKIGANTADLDVNSLLPKAALDAVGDSLGADEAVVLVQEVNSQRRDVEAARRTIAKLRNALSSELRLEMFPELQTGYLGAAELLNRSLLVEAQMNERAGEAFTNASYQRARVERKRVQRLFASVPITAIDVKKRRSRMNASLRKLDMSVNRLQAELTAVDAQLIAIRRFQESKDNRKISKDVAAEFERTRILRKELKSLIWSLENERAKVGTQDYAARDDAKIRRAFREALDRETTLLAQLRPRYVSLRDSLRKSRVILDAYRVEIERKVVGMIREIRSEVESEARKIDKFEAELRVRERDTSRLGGAIAADTYRRAYRSIRGVVLEADVGLVNMAWKRKQDRTQSIRKMQDRKNEDIGRLEEVFSEVSGE